MLPVLLLNLQLVLGGGKEFPDPQKEWRMCGMPRPAFVCDPHFILPRGDGESSLFVEVFANPRNWTRSLRSSASPRPACVPPATRGWPSEYSSDTTSPKRSTLAGRRWPSLCACAGPSPPAAATSSSCCSHTRTRPTSAWVRPSPRFSRSLRPPGSCPSAAATSSTAGTTRASSPSPTPSTTSWCGCSATTSPSSRTWCWASALGSGSSSSWL
ncbi:unnamed protein product [Larinioides sclopetarius]|uniref:Uncharacterized protein n=1 Tax=Larinioides sclopetarius TaxID=280406 RepID=A0AAV2BF41_9ARAC